MICWLSAPPAHRGADGLHRPQAELGGRFLPGQPRLRSVPAGDDDLRHHDDLLRAGRQHGRGVPAGHRRLRSDGVVVGPDPLGLLFPHRHEALVSRQALRLQHADPVFHRSLSKSGDRVHSLSDPGGLGRALCGDQCPGLREHHPDGHRGRLSHGFSHGYSSHQRRHSALARLGHGVHHGV